MNPNPNPNLTLTPTLTLTLYQVAKWHTIISDGSAGSMEAKYENRLCKLTLRAGDAPPLTGLAYNERYLGTLW